MELAVLRKINEARASRQSVTLVSDLETGVQLLVDDPCSIEGALGDEIVQRLKSGKSGIVDIDGVSTFIQVHVPPPRIVIVGAVHISQVLVPMAQACGFDVIVIDPRTAFASEDRFPGVSLHAEWPDVVLQEIPLDPFTAVIAVTHDPKVDDFPLTVALQTGCFYAGALGSKKTHAKRVARLQQLGLDDSQLERIHAPIGLEIGASSPSEIAVAILAQLISTLRKGATV